jgi:glycosyltransferase involved in cell wall biosynthesis
VNGKIRVLHMLPSVHGYGAERQIIELLKSLECDDVEPVLATIYDPPPEIRRALPFQVVSASRKNRRDVAFLVRLIREIRQIRPDIVHTHTHVGKYWGRLASWAARVPRIVHTEHNPCDTRRNAVERMADFLLHRATSRVITFFAEQSEVLRANEGLPPAKVVVIPNGLHLPKEREGDRAAARRVMGLREHDFGIMLIGRMEFQKNQMLALRALAALPTEVRNTCVLAFAGSGCDEEILRGLARALQIEERVRFLGYRSDVPALLAGIDLVLMTSWFEGMPLALIEAMIAGVPIVSTPWIGSTDMLGNGRYGFLTAGYEPETVAASIVDVLTHSAVRHEVARRARQYVYEQYGITRMIEAHRRLYVELCAERVS